MTLYYLASICLVQWICARNQVIALAIWVCLLQICEVSAMMAVQTWQVLGLFIVTVLSISTSRILHRKRQHFTIDQVIPHTRSWRMPAEHDGLIHMLSSWNSFLPSTGHVTPRPVRHWDGETLNPMDCSSSWTLLLSWCLSYLTLKLQMMSLTPLLLPWIAWGRDVIGKQELEQLRVNKW